VEIAALVARERTVLTWQLPSSSVLWRAIEVYLKNAYRGAPPAAVRSRLETLRSLAEGDLYESGVFEQERDSPLGRLRLRLGNEFYPHMKLVIERAPDNTTYLFRADTHDQHCMPAPQSRDYPSFCQLMEQNQTMAQAIESAWEQEGIPTFKSFLRQDLARRRT
jgi:hypothetical protein